MCPTVIDAHEIAWVKTTDFKTVFNIVPNPVKTGWVSKKQTRIGNHYARFGNLSVQITFEYFDQRFATKTIPTYSNRIRINVETIRRIRLLF